MDVIMNKINTENIWSDSAEYIAMHYISLLKKQNNETALMTLNTEQYFPK